MRVRAKRKRGRPPTGSALSPAERMRRLRARRKQAGLKSVSRWVPTEDQVPVVWSSHRIAEARSLALHTRIAAKIARDPQLLEIPRSNLARWAQRCGGDPPPWLEEWRAILQRPWPEVASLLSECSERATRLRQSSPFAGVLTPEERLRIYDAFRA